MEIFKESVSNISKHIDYRLERVESFSVGRSKVNKLSSYFKEYDNYFQTVFNMSVCETCEDFKYPEVDRQSKLYYYLSIPTNINEIVGGYFNIIRTKNGDFMCVNEEGIIKDLPLNEEASDIAGMKIYGNVVVFPDFEGNNNNFRFGLL